MSSGVGGKYELSPSCILNAALDHPVACSGTTLRVRTITAVYGAQICVPENDTKHIN